MEVLINREQVDVTLEHERTLGEVMEGLRGWLNDSQLFITDVLVDQQDVRLDAPENWADTDIDDVGRIEIRALPPWEVKAAGLEVLVQYFTLLQDSLRTGDAAQVRALAADAESIAASLPIYAQDLVDEDERSDPFFRIVDAPEIRGGELPADDRHTELLGYLDTAITVLTARGREIAHPLPEAHATARAIRGLVPDMSEVSVLLQRGEDRRAMDYIVRFTELVAKLLRIMPHALRQNEDPAASTAELERYGTELNTTLQELVGAFGTQDSVLIGDLVEYELVPKIEELLSYVPQEDQAEQA